MLSYRLIASRCLAPAAALVVLSACSSTYKHTLDFDSTEPLRVAVLPFAYENGQGEMVDLKPDLLIDNISVVSSKLEDAPANYVRKLVFSGLEKTGMDLIPPPVVESAFHHHGLSNKLVLDVKRIYSAKPQDLGDMVDADAVLYGRITNWSRNYYGIQTVNTVGLNLQLVSTKTGKDLFVADAVDNDSRGISKGPTGWSSLIIEPVSGLDNQIIVDLARNMVNKMLEPLYVKNRPEFLTSVPPSVYASSHDCSDGIVHPGGHLTVVLLGSPKKLATFSIGNKIRNIHMLEKEDGHYIGEYYPLPSDSITNEQVLVTLTDPFGRTAEQKIGKGLVTVEAAQAAASAPSARRRSKNN